MITGATSGIGRAAALQLGRLGADLILVGRDERRGKELIRRLARSFSGGAALFLKADLSSLGDVRDLALRIRDRCARVDILINNAGTRNRTFRPSPDGIESTFATNHLGHFLLTLLLLERLRAAKAPRIINVSSGAHGSGNGDFEGMLRAGNYDRKLAYANSKLANVLFTYELARRLRGSGITSNALDPGGVATRLGRNDGLHSWIRHIAYHALKGDLVSPRKGADAVVYLAASPAVEGISGKYFCRGREVPSSKLSQDEGAADRLWGLSVRLSGMDPKACPAPGLVEP